MLVTDLADPSDKIAKGNTVFAASSTMMYPVFRLSISLSCSRRLSKSLNRFNLFIS
jgi:hypothetical protein